MHNSLPPRRDCSGSRDPFKIREITDNISETYEIETKLSWDDIETKLSWARHL